jgi:tetratricopeptide (TPR) repeat protein
VEPSQKHRSLSRAHAVCAVIVCLAFGTAIADARSDVLADAAALLDAQHADAAVALLAPLEQARAGDPYYDAALGAALLANGEPARASIALERATAIDPSLAGARLDLGIAYYRMGAREDARQALLAVRELDPPPDATHTIDEYLARIVRDEARRMVRFDLALTSGYDTNPNAATTLDQFLGFVLTPASRASESAFCELTADGGLVQPLRGGFALDTQLSFSARTNPEADFVDTASGQGMLALRQQTARSLRSLELVGYRLDMDGELNSRGAGLGGRWLRLLGERWNAGGFARALAVRYGDALEVKDVDQIAGGFELAHLWGPQGRGGVRADLQLGRDRPRDDASPWGRDLYGIDAGASWRFSPRLLGQLGTGWLRSRYDDAFFPSVLADRRRDTLLLARAQLQWQLAQAWSLDAQLSWSRNRSNVEIYAYDRTALQLGAWRQWR